jgi:arginine decarboxylase
MSHLFGELKRVYLTAGFGKGSTSLNAFDGALVMANVGDYNLVKVSSILPPSCEIVNSITLKKGSLLPIAYGFIISNKEDEIISAAVSIAVPKNYESIGVIMEVSGYYQEETIRRMAYDMALEAMKIRNIEVEKIEVKSISGKVSGWSCAFAGVALF